MDVRGPRGRFAPGNPGGGRPAGKPNKRTVEGEQLARRILAGLDVGALLNELLASDDLRIRLDTIRFLWEQGFGKPRIRADVNLDGLPARWVLELAEPAGPTDRPASPAATGDPDE